MVRGLKTKYLPDGGHVAPRSEPGQNEKIRASFIVVDCPSLYIIIILGEDLSCWVIQLPLSGSSII